MATHRDEFYKVNNRANGKNNILEGKYLWGGWWFEGSGWHPMGDWWWEAAMVVKYNLSFKLLCFLRMKKITSFRKISLMRYLVYFESLSLVPSKFC